jgi:hypothetical protein
MKRETNQGFTPLSVSELKNLCHETKETKLTEKQFKTFSVVDLWAIQKNKKTKSKSRSMAF